MQMLLCCLQLCFGMQMPTWLMRPPTQDRATPAGLSVRPLQSQGMALPGQPKKPTDLEVSLLKAVLLLNLTAGIISLSQRQSLSSQGGRASKLMTENRSITLAMVINLMLVLAKLLATMQLMQAMLMAVTSQLSISPSHSSRSSYPLLTDLQPNEQGSRSRSNSRLARCVTQKSVFKGCCLSTLSDSALTQQDSELSMPCYIKSSQELLLRHCYLPHSDERRRPFTAVETDLLCL